MPSRCIWVVRTTCPLREIRLFPPLQRPVKFPATKKWSSRDRRQLPHRAVAGRRRPDARDSTPHGRGGATCPLRLLRIWPVQVRAISADEVTGDWLPLGLW